MSRTYAHQNHLSGLPIVAFAISIACMLGVAYLYHSLLTDAYDDAYISFRYAANLVHGQGLVFNPGEYVEGYTNFLWTLIAALVIWLGLDPAVVTIMLSVLCGLALLGLVAWFGGRMVEWGRLVAGWQYLAVFILASSGPLAYALISGLETTLFTLLLTAAAFSFVLEQRGVAKWPLSGVLFALAALTRPEGALFWALTVLYQLISIRITPAPIAGQGRAEGASLRWLIGSYLIIWLPYMAWKVFYYGSIFPNTFYTKATANSEQLIFGFAYVFTSAAYLFGPIALFFAFLVPQPIGRLGRIELYFSLLVASNFAYVVLAGGDYMVNYRFLLPVFPLLALLLAASLAAVARLLANQRWGQIFALVCLIACAAIGAANAFNPMVLQAIQVDGEGSQRTVPIIQWLQHNAQPGDSLALETIGKVPYYSGIYTIDMLGLTDAHIAHSPGRNDAYYTPGHSKTDIVYVLSRQPTYIMVYKVRLGNGRYTTLPSVNPASTQLLTNSQFAASYSKVVIFQLIGAAEGWLYKRNP